MAAQDIGFSEFWRRIPLFRVTLAFIAGIIAQIFLSLSFESIFYSSAGILFAVLTFTFLRPLSHSYRLRWVYGFFIHAFFVSAGCLLTYFNTGTNEPGHVSHLADGTRTFVGRISNPLHEKTKSYKTVVKLLSASVSGKQIPVNGKAILYLEKDSLSAQLKYNDVIIFRQKLSEIKPPQNPGEFNYKRYLRFHNIYQQVYLKTGSWHCVSAASEFSVIRSSIVLRDKLVSILKESLGEKRLYAVTSALLIGYENDLDQELINAFSSAGALHVLSVSGLHVGAIYVALSSLLVFMDKRKLSRYFKYFFLIAFIWFYAMVTGFSPSVLRAAVMLSLVIIAKWYGGQNSVFNSLVASCFLLLLYDPFLITEVGFQLSYLALFGIVYFHPYIFSLLEPADYLLSKAWEIISVSLSAQLATFPLGLLYFHQFPNLFFVSNLVVIPVSTALIFLSIALVALYSIPVIGWLLAKVCFGLAWFLNASVLLVDEIPYSILTGISISITETWIIYVIIFSAWLFITERRKKLVFISLSLGAGLLAYQVYESVMESHQRALVVYNVPKSKAIDVIHGKRHTFIADSVLAADESKMLFHITHHRWARGIDKSQLALLPAAKVLKAGGMSIYILDKKIPHAAKPLKRIDVDYLVLSGNIAQNIMRLKDFFNFKMLIIDSSYSAYRSKKIKSDAENKKVRAYSVLLEGAFVEEL